VVYTGSYALVLILHLLTVVFMVGPTAVASVASARHARAGETASLRTSMRTTRLYGVATVVTVVLGTALVGLGDVGEQWEFSQVWISASYLLWFVAVALTLAVVVPAQEAAVQALEKNQDAGSFASRISIGGGLVTLAYTVIIVLMVLKPGA